MVIQNLSINNNSEIYIDIFTETSDLLICGIDIADNPEFKNAKEISVKDTHYLNIIPYPIKGSVYIKIKTCYCEWDDIEETYQNCTEGEVIVVPLYNISNLYDCIISQIMQIKDIKDCSTIQQDCETCGDCAVYNFTLFQTILLLVQSFEEDDEESKNYIDALITSLTNRCNSCSYCPKDYTKHRRFIYGVSYEEYTNNIPYKDIP